jgi:hypothetical protein
MGAFWLVVLGILEIVVGAYSVWVLGTSFWVSSVPALSIEVSHERLKWSEPASLGHGRVDTVVPHYRYSYEVRGTRYAGSGVSNLLVYDFAPPVETPQVWYVVPFPAIAMLVRPDPWYVALNLLPLAVCTSVFVIFRRRSRVR